MRTCQRSVIAAILACFVLGPVACESVPRTTRYQAADIDLSVESIQQQLVEHPFIQSRDESSPPIRLMPFELENQSNERLSRVDQWAAVSRVFLNPDVLELLGEKNIHVVMPPDATHRLEQFGVDGLRDRTVDRELATHAIRAVFMSSTRVAGDGSGDVADARRDDFLIDYSISEVDSGRMVWSGAVEIARYAHGVLAD